LKTGAERAATIREMALDKDLHWREVFTRTQVKGVQTVDGEECDEIELTPKEGAPEIRYYSRKTGYLRKVSMVLNSPMGDIPSETLMSGYSATDGVLSPRVLTTTMAGQVMAVSIERVIYNENLAEKNFELPPDIKALADRKPAGSK